MPISYDINPDLHVVVYLCRGVITATELFETADMILLDQRCQPGMITIVDLFFAVENVYLEDVHEVVRRFDKTADEGSVPGPIVILSHSTGIHILVDAIQLLHNRVPWRMKAYHTMDDAIHSLGLLTERDKILRFWKECYALYESPAPPLATGL